MGWNINGIALEFEKGLLNGPKAKRSKVLLYPGFKAGQLRGQPGKVGSVIGLCHEKGPNRFEKSLLPRRSRVVERNRQLTRCIHSASTHLLRCTYPPFKLCRQRRILGPRFYRIHQRYIAFTIYQKVSWKKLQKIQQCGIFREQLGIIQSLLQCSIMFTTRCSMKKIFQHRKNNHLLPLL